MKDVILIFLILSLLSCGSGTSPGISSRTSEDIHYRMSAAAAPSQQGKARYREGELLVKFRSGVSRTSAARLHQAVNASVVRHFVMVPNLEHIKLPGSSTTEAAIAKYLSDPAVEYAEPNYIRHTASTIPNDPLSDRQWALFNAGQLPGYAAGADIKAFDAWDVSTGSDGVVIAVLDTGLDYDHPDLASNVWANPGETACSDGVDSDNNGYVDDCKGWNFVSRNNDPTDDNGHGTHVAGIVGAVGNNGIGVSGLMWKVRLMPLKILDAVGDGTVADEIAAIEYAMAKGAKVLNESFSGSEYSSAEHDAISAAGKEGILLIAAAGNGSNGISGDNNDAVPLYPAGYNLNNIISVAATNQRDILSSFSNYGQTSVHVAAPGVDIFSTYSRKLAPSGYDYLSGTSMSTPFVSGLAGLLFGYYQQLTAYQIRGTIMRYVDALPTLQGMILTGGRINAYKAISSLLPPSGTSVALQSSTSAGLSWTDNANGEDGYFIERKAGQDPFAQIANLAANAASYVDSSILDGTSYQYRVKAYNSLPNPPGSSVISAASSAAEVAVTTPLNPPAGLQAAVMSGSKVVLTWNDNSQAEEGFKIERKSFGGDFVQVAVIGRNSGTFTDTGLSPSSTYSYTVRAFNTAAGDSVDSNEVTVTTLATSAGTGGGGGCSVGPRRKEASAVADAILFVIPLLAIRGLKNLGRRKKDGKKSRTLSDTGAKNEDASGFML